MGKLLEKLNQIVDFGGPRLGFASGQDEQKGHMGIVALLGTGDKKLVSDAIANGADAVAISGKRTKALGNLAPIGTIGSAGGDFVLLTLSDNVGELLEDGDVDVVLALEPEISEDLLLSVEALPVDAVIVEVPVPPATLRDLIPLYRTARSTRKPLFAKVPIGLSAAQLACVRDAGADAVVVDVGKDSLKRLKLLRDEITALRPQRNRLDRVKATPSLGLTGAAG